MEFLVTSALRSTGRAASRAALPLGLSVAIMVFLTMAYVMVLAGVFVLLAQHYSPATAWFTLAGFNALAAIILVIVMLVMMKRRKEQRRSAELTALALAIAPRLLVKSPVASLLAVGAAAYVLAKARSD